MLHTDGIQFAPWGVAIVKALLLAKFMLVGRALKIGERNTTSPLIWPTLYKAFAFLVLLVILTIIEEAVVGLFHGQSITASLRDLVGRRLEETLAGYLIMLLVLMPYFAFRVLGEVLGESRMTRCSFLSVSWRAEEVTSACALGRASHRFRSSSSRRRESNEASGRGRGGREPFSA